MLHYMHSINLLRAMSGISSTVLNTYLVTMNVEFGKKTSARVLILDNVWEYTVRYLSIMF